MKKIFILATAAIVAFASCMKTEIVSNSEPQEIAFRQFTGSMTKADPTDLASFASTMGVFGYHTNSGTTALYINNGIFKHSTDGKWGGEPTKYYWPLQGTMDFTVYAPHAATGVSYDKEYKKLEVTIADNSGETQTDYLYGKIQCLSQAKIESIPVTLKHALSKVTINVKADAPDVFTVSKVSLKDTYQSGSYTVTYSSNSDNKSVITTNASSVKSDMVYMSGTVALTTDYLSKSKLVVPSDQTKIVIEYTMKGSEAAPLTATIDLVNGADPVPEWETGKHYTYNITLKADEILFTPSVDDWGPVTEPSELYNHTIG